MHKSLYLATTVRGFRGFPNFLVRWCLEVFSQNVIDQGIYQKGGSRHPVNYCPLADRSLSGSCVVIELRKGRDLGREREGALLYLDWSLHEALKVGAQQACEWLVAISPSRELNPKISVRVFSNDRPCRLIVDVESDARIDDILYAVVEKSDHV